MSVRRTTVLVQCNERSHEPIPVHRFQVRSPDGGDTWTWSATTDQTLINDDLLDEDAVRKLHGSVLRAPDFSQRDATRLRWSLECPRCGLRADMRLETAKRVVLGYANAGKFEIDLSLLAASL